MSELAHKRLLFNNMPTSGSPIAESDLIAVTY